jgi:hypothetical protein
MRTIFKRLKNKRGEIQKNCTFIDYLKKKKKKKTNQMLREKI